MLLEFDFKVGPTTKRRSNLKKAVGQYCQLKSRRNKNREADKINPRSSSDQLIIALMQVGSSRMTKLDLITVR